MNTPHKEKESKRMGSMPSTTRRTLHYYGQVTKKHLGLFFGLMFSTFAFVALLRYGNPYFMSLIVDHVSQNPVAASEVFTAFGPLIATLALVNILGQAASKLQDYTLYKLEIAAAYDLARMSFDALTQQSMSFHSNRFEGTLVSQSSKFMQAYGEILETITFPFMPMFASIIVTVATLAPRVPIFVAVIMALLVVYAMISYYMYKRILHLNENAASAQNQLSGELADSIGNILAVKTYGKEDFERKLFDQANTEVVKRDSKRMRASIMRGVVTALITIVIMTIVSIFIAGGNAWFNITPGTLVIMFTYTYNITNQFNFINNGLQRLNRAFGNASGMTMILDEPRLVQDKPQAPRLVVTKGNIDFKNINFAYFDAQTTTTIFENFNLSVCGGQRLGLVGKSGSGKTTLTKLLLRLSDIQAGEILIDGQNIAEVSQQSLRQHIAYVPQEPILFHRSIAENIAYGKPDATPEEIYAAAKNANALEFIEALPEGFDTITGERGVKLSGGQRQRIVIARALLADCPILVLDEATSALDSASEKLVQDALQTLMKGRTCLIVAHRLSTVACLDRIVVIENGEVIEDGTHQELLAKRGAYADLWDRQSGAYLD
ncbi:MAG: ABC transporter ATP-binding protein [Coriobacteriia bacterium]|nr:ABC transporter ATP-binding protein [Coriobacteriia bacterium]